MEHNQVDKYTYYRCPRRRKRESCRNVFRKIVIKNFPNVGKETDTKIQET